MGRVLAPLSLAVLSVCSTGRLDFPAWRFGRRLAAPGPIGARLAAPADSDSPAVYSLDGLLVFGLLLVCTCAYLRKVPRLKAWLLSEKRGVWGVFYKAAVIGTRLHVAVAVSCVLMAFYVLVVK
ncbi:PREDICTED: protein kish-B [Haliaeetus leucocephalus]|nr:PREDICTED: protein kish-B [Haliaeetus leucocephalus]